MIKQALFALLAADAGVSAIANDRIYPQVIPSENFDSLSKKPCIVYRRGGVERQPLLCGTSPTMRSLFVVDCYAKTYAGAESLANAVRAAVVDFQGTVLGVIIRTVHLEGEFDLLDIEPGLHRVSMQLNIWHEGP